jgi:hypothetical protein
MVACFPTRISGLGPPRPDDRQRRLKSWRAHMKTITNLVRLDRIASAALATAILLAAGAANAQPADLSQVQIKTTDLGHMTYKAAAATTRRRPRRPARCRTRLMSGAAARLRSAAAPRCSLISTMRISTMRISTMRIFRGRRCADHWRQLHQQRPLSHDRLRQWWRHQRHDQRERCLSPFGE